MIERLDGRQAATAKMILIWLAAIVIAIVFWPVALCVLALYALVFWVAPVLLALLAAATMGSPTLPTPVYLMEPRMACFNSQKVQISCATHESPGETFGTQSGLPLRLWTKVETFNSLAACQERLDA